MLHISEAVGAVTSSVLGPIVFKLQNAAPRRPGRADMQATALLPKGLRFREARPVVGLAFPGPNHRVGMNMTGQNCLPQIMIHEKKLVIHLALKFAPNPLTLHIYDFAKS